MTFVLSYRCFEFDDIAGKDLANLMVSTRRTGLMKQLFFSGLRQAKSTHGVSLNVAVKHFLQHQEDEERVHRAVGRLTTALGSVIAKALDYESLDVGAERRKLSVVLLEPRKGLTFGRITVLSFQAGPSEYSHEHEAWVLHESWRTNNQTNSSV